MKAIALISLLLLFVPTAAAKDNPDKDCPERLVSYGMCNLSPEEFTQQVNTPPRTSFSMRLVSAAEALEGANRPGATTETAEGLTAPEATGAAMEVEDDGGGGTPDAYRLCAFGTLSSQWGTWPVQQIVKDNTYWCWNSGSLNLTYRSTNVTTDATLCTSDGDYSFRYYGGIGNPYVYIEAGAYFHCQTPYPWVSLNPHRCLHDVWYPYGASIVSTDCFQLMRWLVIFVVIVTLWTLLVLFLGNTRLW